MIITLQARAPAMNRLRSRRVETAQDLFGIWHASVTFGRIGYPGHTTSRQFEAVGEMQRFVRRALLRRRTAVYQLGVAYEAVEASIAAQPLLVELGFVLPRRLGAWMDERVRKSFASGGYGNRG